MAGRVARAHTTEPTGVWREDWTIEETAEQFGAIRGPNSIMVFPAMQGFMDHLDFSLDMAKRGQAAK